MSYATPREAALALLNEFPDLAHREAGFLGHCAVASDLTDKQASWLSLILKRRGLPALAEGGEQ